MSLYRQIDRQTYTHVSVHSQKLMYPFAKEDNKYL